MALKHTPAPSFGESAHDFDLLGTDGDRHTLETVRGEHGTLVMFICNHCPYVKAINERLVADCLELEKMGVGIVAIMSNDPTDYPEDSYDNMQAAALALNYPFPYVWDEDQEVAKTYGAVCTPDFFGYNADLELQYRGRLDASGANATSQPTTRDLVDAFKQIVKTGKGPADQTPSMGCSIKWTSD